MENKAILYYVPEDIFAKKIQAYLKTHNINYKRKNMHNQDNALEIFQITNQAASPQLIYKDVIIVGYDVQALDMLFDS